MTQGTFDFPQRALAHLRLARQVPTGARVSQPSRYPRTPKHPDQPVHGAKLKAEVAQLRAIFAKRRNVLGVEPENVAVMAFSSPPDEQSLNRAGLRVLEWHPDRVVVASPGDPRMEEFYQRLDKYQSGPADASASAAEDESPTDSLAPGGDDPTSDGENVVARPPTAPYQSLFDLIEEVRELSPAEVLTPAAAAAIASAGLGQLLILDVQCWCPEDRENAQARHDATAEAVKVGGGRVIDQSLRHTSGVSLIRIEAAASLAEQLASLPHVRRIDRIPRPVVTYLEAMRGGSEVLPPVVPPAVDAPLIAVIDSGIRSGHPLISPAFAGSTAVDGLDEEVDGNGHGTFVASLALFGSLERLLEQARTPAQPAGRVLSVRVLDDHAQFPETELWENDLLWALNVAASAGARIVNLSLGDMRRPYTPSRPTPLAAAVDAFVREHGAVVVISTGNMTMDSYDSDADADNFTARQLDAEDAGLLDPATSALALTVGALGADEGQGAQDARDSVDVLPFGAPNIPSPLTRSGPGAANMIKPEMVAPGGHLARTGLGSFPQVKNSTSVLGADGTRPDRLLAIGVGSSYAAPLVSHVAARALGANPGLSGRGVRALVLASVLPVESFLDPGGAEQVERERRLVGYGRPDGDRAAHSTDHRVLLIAEESIRVDDVHLYSVPIPDSFFESGGWRRLSVALAFDPATRSTRYDYLASRMQVHVYRRVTVEEVADAYLADRRRAPEEAADASEPTPGDSGASGPASLASFRIELQPADKVRGRGAHIFGTKQIKQRLRTEEGREFVIAVQNINRWQAAGAVEPYALAVILERDIEHAAIYAQLQAALEAELPVEVLL